MIISINVRLLTEQSVPISSNTFGGTPFLEKGPPKITEGRPFVPRWPISRINPDLYKLGQKIKRFAFSGFASFPTFT